jgi:hypothetical protein
MAEYTGKDNRRWNDVAANKTLVADTDCGVVQNVTADAKTVTLPAAVAGVEFIIRNAGAAPAGAPAGTGSNGTCLVTIAPNGTDTIGGGGRAAANSNLVNTKATANVGDEVRLSGISGGWKIIHKVGIWA